MSVFVTESMVMRASDQRKSWSVFNHAGRYLNGPVDVKATDVEQSWHAEVEAKCQHGSPVSVRRVIRRRSFVADDQRTVASTDNDRTCWASRLAYEKGNQQVPQVVSQRVF
jgi:hypothetical protein